MVIEKFGKNADKSVIEKRHELKQENKLIRNAGN